MAERIIFFSVFTVTLMVLSMLAGKSIAMGLRIPQQAPRWFLLVAGLIPLFFILSMVLVRTNEGLFSRIISVASNSIAGVAIYICLGGILIGLLLGVTALVGHTLPRWIPVIILIIAALLPLIGFIQTQMTKVTSYTVAIQGLPLSWQEKRAVFISDTHFGAVHQGAFSRRTIAAIKKQSPDIVFHAGDFYDGPMIPLAPIVSSWKELTREVPVFFAPGNHEGYGDYDTFIASLKEAGVTVLEDAVVEHDGVLIAGLSYRDKEQYLMTDVILQRMKVKEKPSILINHPPTFHKQVAENGVDLMLSGHSHNGQFWPLGYIVRLIYGVYMYGLHSYETLSAITTSGVGTFGPPLRLFNTPEIVVITFSKK